MIFTNLGYGLILTQITHDWEKSKYHIHIINLIDMTVNYEGIYANIPLWILKLLSESSCGIYGYSSGDTITLCNDVYDICEITLDNEGGNVIEF